MKEKFIGKSLLLEDEKGKKILVVSDLHLGYDEMLNKEGVFISFKLYDKIISELDGIFSGVGGVDYVVVLGDLRHEFSVIGKGEWKEVLGLVDYLKEKCKDIILIGGNHDNMLWGVVKQKGLSVVYSWKFGDYLFFHGDKLVEDIGDKNKQQISLSA
jgi:hypothetical protein